MIKSKLFVGSSTEAKDIARAFCSELHEDAHMIPWWNCNDFKTMESTLDGLLHAIHRYDFGLFILTPTDKLTIRGKKLGCARDNVLFEAGLFLGAIGRKRTFAVIQKPEKNSNKFRVPSDLEGITIPWFDATADQDELVAHVLEACKKIRQRIKQEGRRNPPLNVLRGHGWNRKSRKFVVRLAAQEINEHIHFLKGARFMLVAMKHDSGTSYLNETNITVGPERKIEDIEPDDPQLTVTLNKNIKLKASDIVDAHLVLLPKNANINGAKTLSQMRERGCYLLHAIGKPASTK